MLIIHVGMGKAGSSSIQATLRLNRHRLRKQGVVWPKAAQRGGCNFGELANDLTDNSSAGNAVAELRELLESSRSITVALSSEHLQRTPLDGTRRLKEMADRAGHEVKIVAYVRNYADWAKSKYFQRVRMRAVESGGRKKRLKTLSFDKYFPKLPTLAGAKRWLVPWGDAFGTEALHVRHISALPDRDVVTDFMNVLGATDIRRGKDRNVSLHWLQVELARAMFECEAKPGSLSRSKQSFWRFLYSLEPGIAELQVPDANYLTKEQREQLEKLYEEDALWLKDYADVPLPPPRRGETPGRDFLPSIDLVPDSFWQLLHRSISTAEWWNEAPYIVNTLEKLMGRSALRRETRSPTAIT